MAAFLIGTAVASGGGMGTKTGIATMTESSAVHPESLPMNLLIVDDEQYVRQL
jgi:hypothetical protein